MWLILERAINDFDIRESRQSREGSAPHEPEADLIRERISQEALHAALRISALVRLDLPSPVQGSLVGSKLTACSIHPHRPLF